MKKSVIAAVVLLLIVVVIGAGYVLNRDAYVESVDAPAVQTEAPAQTDAVSTEAPAQADAVSTEAPAQTDAVSAEAPAQADAVNAEAPAQADAENTEAAVLMEGEAVEDASEIYDIAGEIVEISDAYILIETQQHGQVQVNLAEDTVIDGAQELSVGQTVVVMYNGMMTRSLPAQITALSVGMYAVTGEVTEIAEGMITLMRADTGAEVMITLPENAQSVAVGDRLIVYTTGTMTMSLPPQMNAIAFMQAE